MINFEKTRDFVTAKINSAGQRTRTMIGRQLSTVSSATDSSLKRINLSFSRRFFDRSATDENEVVSVNESSSCRCGDNVECLIKTYGRSRFYTGGKRGKKSLKERRTIGRSHFYTVPNEVHGDPTPKQSTRKCSSCFFVPSEDNTTDYVSERIETGSSMEKQKRCMKKLNSSRPRTEIGQPAVDEDENTPTHQDSHTHPTAVASSEDDLVKVSVQSLLSNFENSTTKQNPNDIKKSKPLKPKPSPKPTRNFTACGNAMKKPLPKPKPRSQPNSRQHSRQNSEEDLTMPAGVEKEKPKTPSPPPTKPKPKAMIVKTSTKPRTSEDNQVNGTEVLIQYKLPESAQVDIISESFEKPLEVNNILYEKFQDETISISAQQMKNTEQSLTEQSSPIAQEKTKETKGNTQKTIKQKSTKPSPQSDEQLAYAIVTLPTSNSTNDLTGDDELALYASCDDKPREEDEKNDSTNAQYLVPVDSPRSKIPANERPADLKIDGEKSTKKKRGLFKLKTSKSMAMSKIPQSVEDLRRQSLPEFNQNAVDSASPDEATAVNDQMRVEVAKPEQVSDDEVWNSDEFDSSEEDEDDGQSDMENEEPIAKLAHLEGTKKKLYNIVTEILTTERAYVKRLYLLDKIFNERLQMEAKKDPTVVTDKVLKEIFSNVSQIHMFHSTTLLPALEERIKEWERNDKIGDIFKTLGHFLLLYTEYVKNFDHATDTLNHWLKKSPRFASLIQELQKNRRCENLSLQHHMLEPIQRVPRYKLLLADYLKRLPEDSPDRSESEASLVIISKAADNANSSMKENEKFKKLLEIEDRIIDGMRGESLVLASREFIKEGELTKLASRSGNRQPRTILLFNDILLYSQLTPTGKLKVCRIMDLLGLTIYDRSEVTELPGECSFRIKSKQKVLDLDAKTEEEKNEWMETIRDAVKDIETKRGSRIKEAMMAEDSSFKLGEQAPLWVKDEFVSMCMLCASKFGIIHRKHHCRGCGDVVCGKCSSYQAVLTYAGESPNRVCYACYKKLVKNTEVDVENKELKSSVKVIDSGVESDIDGEMFWKSPGKDYKKGWLLLGNFILYVRKKKQDMKAQLTVAIPSYTVELQEETDSVHPFCLKLHKANMKDLTYYIATDNKELIQQWFDHLTAASQMTKL